MSLPNFTAQSSLFSTAVLSGDLFAEDDRYRNFARLVYPRLVAARIKLESCYCPDNGRVAIEPVLMLGVSFLQFIDGLPDRAAVEMLRYHAGWNFALNRQLGDELFHPSSLVNFRARLIEGGLSSVGFETILDGLVQAGLMARRSQQRLDSTQIMGKISRMSRLECVRESLRLALKELEELLGPESPRPSFWTELWDRYVDSKLDYRAETSVLQGKMIQAGKDATQLLDWVKELASAQLSQGEKLQVLQRVWKENFQVDTAGQLETTAAPPAGAVHNPHDPEAQWAAKGQGKHKKEHVGYKVQVAETVQSETLQKGEPTPNFITAMVTQPAIASDEAGLVLVEREQAQMALEKPSHLYVDGAYVSAAALVQAQAEGQELIGPAQPAPKKEGRFSVENFQINVQTRKAICPAGKENMQCSRLEEEQTGKVSYRFEWGSHCHECPLRQQCLGKDQRHRTVAVGEHHSHLQARRLEQKTEQFKEKARRRNAIEGTQSELVRAHGLRRARYCGLKKVRLQNYLAGAACNIKRWIRRQVWEINRAKHAAAAQESMAVS
jgi:transposase